MTADANKPEPWNALVFVLAGLSRSDDIHDVIREFGPLGRFANSGAGEDILGLAADALTLGRLTRTDQLDYLSLRERFLPEVEVSGKYEHYKSDWILRAVSTLAAGVDPGIDDQLRFWSVLDLERWAIHALFAYARAAADHVGASIADLCSEIAGKNGISLPQ